MIRQIGLNVFSKPLNPFSNSARTAYQPAFETQGGDTVRFSSKRDKRTLQKFKLAEAEIDTKPAQCTHLTLVKYRPEPRLGTVEVFYDHSDFLNSNFTGFRFRQPVSATNTKHDNSNFSNVLAEQGVNFANSSFINSHFNYARLHKAIFDNTWMEGGSLAHLYAPYASFKNLDIFAPEELVDGQLVTMPGTDFKGIKVPHADFRGADLRQAINMDWPDNNFTDALYDDKTQFPEGFKPQKYGMKLVPSTFEKAAPVLIKPTAEAHVSPPPQAAEKPRSEPPAVVYLDDGHFLNPKKRKNRKIIQQLLRFRPFTPDGKYIPSDQRPKGV